MPLQRLQYLINTVPDKLRAIPDADFNHKPAPGKWSKKEIIGHLVDSAANNHHRFIRAQFEDVPKITYDQNNWNTASCYQDMDSNHVIDFWASYNQHIIEVVKRIPETDMQRECNNGGENNVTLQWLIADYVSHMEHHLKQIFSEDFSGYDFIATLQYRTAGEGGRSTPAKSGYRPAIKFPFDKMYTSGMQYFIDRECVLPGETINTAIAILAAPYFEGRLEEGMEFVFTEGPRIIGTGIITKIVNEKLKKVVE